MNLKVLFSESDQNLKANFSATNESFKTDIGETTVLYNGQNGATFIPSVSEADYGKLLYIDENGKCAFLAIGSGLRIENGVLMLSGTVTPSTGNKTVAVLGTATLGQMILGKGA